MTVARALAGLWLSTWLATTAIDSEGGGEFQGVDRMLEAIFDESERIGFDLNHDRHVGAADLVVLLQYHDFLPPQPLKS